MMEDGDQWWSYLYGRGWPLPNVWLGVSAEDQETADARIPQLLDTPAAVRFVSAEPLLGPINLAPLHTRDFVYGIDRHASLYALRGKGGYQIPDSHWMEDFAKLDWVIIGGESGPQARPMDATWARALVDQCRDAGVSCFVKQLGKRPVMGEVPVSLRDSKGGDPSEWPEDLRVREWPR